MHPIQIQMLGSFALESGGVVISDNNNRSRKMWSLLAHLLCNRDRVIPQKTLLDLLWSAETGSENPENALRITLYRLRGLLDRLWSGAGKDLILHKEGGYCWNSDCELTIDCVRFEELITRDTLSENERLQNYLQALELYRGEFLPKYSSEFWVIPLSTHFHNLFLQASIEATAMLLTRQRYDEALSICRRATVAEPYHEPLHRLLMSVLGSKGDYAGAAKVYEDLAKRLSDDFGIQPNSETVETFRRNSKPPKEQAVPMEHVLEQLQEEVKDPGALICQYDEFKTLCRARARVMERTGDETHVALMSLVSSKGEPLSKRTLSKVMGDLEQALQKNLRRGDVIARCSGSQIVVMLVDANYDNSNMVCRRLLNAFMAANPRSFVKVNYMVQPLSSHLNMP